MKEKATGLKALFTKELVAISHDYTMLLISIFMFELGSGMYFPSASAILAESVPVTWVGTAMGIYGLMEDVGWMIGHAAGGLLLNYWSIRSPFVFGAIVSFLAVPLFLWGRRLIPNIARAQQTAQDGMTGSDLGPQVRID